MSSSSLIWLIAVVLVGLSCQVTWYLTLMAVFGRMSPSRFLRGASDVMASTFSTASTAATIPITLRALTGKLGVSRESSQLAACVGTNFNNDGTALYQAIGRPVHGAGDRVRPRPDRPGDRRR